MNKELAYSGLVIMVMSTVFFIFMHDLTPQKVGGIAMLFIIGLGMAIAGSPDPNKEKK